MTRRLFSLVALVLVPVLPPQGVEAQTVAVCYTALEQGLEVIPVLNKIDLPQAEPERVIQEIEELLDTNFIVFPLVDKEYIKK